MGNFLLYSRRNCPYFYIGGELKKVNFTLQVSPEKIVDKQRFVKYNKSCVTDK